MIFLPQTIPRCLRQMIQSLPICLNQETDSEYSNFQAIQILKKHGEDLSCSSHSIKQVIDLASGPSDLIVILERLLRETSHRPDTTFDGFVNTCDTLIAVDELLRFASRGTRGIKTVTVVDAFLFQPDKEDQKADLACEKTIKRFLQIKKPKVIIHCTNSNYQSDWMKRFYLGGGSYRVKSQLIDIDEGHHATVIPSFHPSHAIYHNRHRLGLRVLLMYHFALAFRLLAEEKVDSCCEKEIQKRCREDRNRKLDTEFSLDNAEWDLKLASRMLNKTSDPYSHPGKATLPRSKGFPERITEKTQHFDLFRFASASFLLKEARRDSSLIFEVSSILLDLSTEQDHWFKLFKTDDADITAGETIEGSLSGLAIEEDSRISPQIIISLQLIIDSNRKACYAVHESRHYIEKGEIPTFTHRRFQNRIHLEEHDTHVARYLAGLQGINFTAQLRIGAYKTLCRGMSDEIFKSKENDEICKLKESDDKGNLPQLNRLLENLRKLRMEVELQVLCQ